MQVFQQNREVRALDRIANLAYFGAWIITVFLLVGIPAIKFLPGSVADTSFSIDVPVSITKLDATIASTLNAPGIALTDVYGDVAIPIKTAPVSFLAITWIGLAIRCALAILILHQLRRLFQRVRAGAPFDVENAVRLRSIGRLLLVQYIFKAVYVYVMSGWVASTLDGSSVPFGSMPYTNWGVLFVALVLIALSEIFRRGAALEDEQALVV